MRSGKSKFDMIIGPLVQWKRSDSIDIRLSDGVLLLRMSHPMRSRLALAALVPLL